MTIVCSAPDTSLAVAARLSVFLDCQARALGENGFQALAGGPLGAALLSACVTLFVALIGYRLILGHSPNVGDGIGWTVRLGFVLALVTSWPAFQALVYGVAVDGPAQLTSVILPAAKLPSENLPVQQAYDVLRLGMPDEGAVPMPAQEGDAASQTDSGLLPAMPITASVFVMSTAGLSGALSLGIGFLLAVAPIALIGLLFRGTVGLFNGWIRALAGLALSLVAATVVTSAELVMIESELSRVAMLSRIRPGAVDEQGLMTIVISFGLVAAVLVVVALKMASALKLPSAKENLGQRLSPQPASRSLVSSPAHSEIMPEHRPERQAGRARAAAVAEALAANVQREHRLALVAGSHNQRAPHAAATEPGSDQRQSGGVQSIGLAGRRGLGGNTRSAARRDKMV